ncbi:MAG TPA: F0F1 ATP synthase subunit A [Gemmatimonadaceae bacterium]|nr:F0F1 ATP synthase subunit A [Gemmatimonadaceae bacterium]
MRFGLALAFALVTSVTAAAQEHAPARQDVDSLVSAKVAEEIQGHAPEEQHAGESEASQRADIITPHITDSHHMECPASWKIWEARECALPRWEPIHLGGLTLDLSPTKHVIMLWIAAILTFVTLFFAGRGGRRYQEAGRAPKGFPNAIEAVSLYMRNEVIMPNVGHHGERYVPFILTLFYFILFANILGLIPYGSTATGNISVTATLAILSFLMVEWAGMRTLGRGYINTIVYWPHDMPLAMKLPMTLIMTPVEIIGKFTKPFALAIRLFANMTAGHVVVLALVGLIFTFGSWWVAGGPFLMALAIMLLELFVAFLQAFIFSVLTSVFIGQIREGAH